MIPVYNILGYFFEMLISFMYFEKKFTPKINKIYIRLLLYIASFGVMFGVGYVGDSNINLAVFVICNCLLCFLCYDVKFALSVFNSILLASLLLVTELFVYYVFQYIYWSDIPNYISYGWLTLIQNVALTLVYFLIVLVILLLSEKSQKTAFKYTMSVFTLLLPVASILILTGIVRMTQVYTTDSYIYAAFGISALVLLYAYIVVFGVYESIVKTRQENIELRLQKQRSEIDTAYYNILQEQYENSNMLIHDIKRHLMSIKELSSAKDNTAINNYIDGLYGEYQIKYLKSYSSNRLVNAIVSRYAMFCNDNNIDFYCDIRDIDFSFISDNNLTSVLDNLLENATEASKDAKDRIVELTITPTNVNFITINIWNTCSKEPQFESGKLHTDKKDSSIHGFGLKIVERIVNQHNGNISYSFDKQQMKFNLSIVLKIN